MARELMRSRRSWKLCSAHIRGASGNRRMNLAFFCMFFEEFYLSPGYLWLLGAVEGCAASLLCNGRLFLMQMPWQDTGR